MSNPPKDVTINAVDDSIGCLTQPCGTLSDGVEYRLDIRRRASNYLQNLSGRSLLLQGLLCLVEQPDVFNGDDSLISESLKERYLFF